MSIQPNACARSRWSRTGKSNAGGSPTCRIDDGVVLGEAVRRLVVGRVRDAVEQLGAPPLRRGELLLERLELDLHLLELGELLRRRLALQLPLRAQLLDPRLHREHRAIGGRAARRRARPRPCARARRRSSSGSLRAARRSITRVSLGTPRAGRRPLRPPPAGRRARRAPRISSCAFATATAKPAQSSSSRSFSPSPQATVCAAVKPRRSATNCRPAPLLTSGCANSRKYGSDFETNRRPAKRGFSSASSSSSACSSPTATSFVGAVFSQSRSGPTAWISRCWKPA